MRRVILSMTRNESYDFYAPISSIIWRDRIGFEPLVLLYGNKTDWMICSDEGPIKHPSVAELQLLGVDVEYVGNVKGMSSILSSKLSRYLACFLNLDMGDYLITSDVDIWPISETFFQENVDEEVMTFWNGNAHGFGQFPTCYIGATVRKWREFWNLNTSRSIRGMLEDLAYAHSHMSSSWPGWWSDEKFMAEKLMRYCLEEQAVLVETRLEDTRICRSAWPRKIDLDGKHDAHVMRPGTDDKVWGRTRNLLEMLIPSYMENIEFYRNQYKEMIKCTV